MKISLTNSFISPLFLLIFAGFTLAFPLPTIGMTINAASCSQSAVQTAINSAVTGDTVAVPSGTCSWGGTTVSIPSGKDIILQGAGIDSTTINSTDGSTALSIDFGSSRVTGFTFSCGTIDVDGEGWRVDHNKLTCSSFGEGVYVRGDRKTDSPKGLMDNNTFINRRVLSVAYPGVSSAELQGTSHWANPPAFGTDEAVYVEDNTFTFTVFGNAIDCNYSGRYVFRNNTVTDVYLEAHSVQGFNRACRKWEIYNNTIRQVSQDMYFMMFLRGGAGINFLNTATGVFGTAPNLTINNVRSCRDVGSPMGKCTGASTWDQNTAGQSGWFCRDQIGTGQDTSPWIATPPPAQTTLPAYFFLNKINGSNMGVAVVAGETCPGGDLNDIHLKPNRDYYAYTSSFTGTTGVGSGTLASRPSACTTGVAYWVTDQGEWNSSQAGSDGQLYKCTATNTWSLYYTPYVYPHPLQGSTPPPDTTPPAAPAGLTIQ